MKPVRLSSEDLSKVSFPTLKKTDAQDSNLLRSNLGVKISERIFPKETPPPVAQWVQDFSSPPPRFSTKQLDMMTPMNFER